MEGVLSCAGVDVLELVRSVRRFAQQFAYDLPGQHFVERVAAAREVPKLPLTPYSSCLPSYYLPMHAGKGPAILKPSVGVHKRLCPGSGCP